MTASNHVLTGVVIGSAITTSVVALPLAFLSHFLLDALPHYDSGNQNHTTRKFLYVLTVDMAFAASILLSLAVLKPDNWLLLLLAGIAGASPDLMWLPRWINELRGTANKPLGRIASFHSRIQRYAKPKNWPAELVWLVAMLGVASGLVF